MFCDGDKPCTGDCTDSAEWVRSRDGVCQALGIRDIANVDGMSPQSSPRAGALSDMASPRAAEAKKKKKGLQDEQFSPELHGQMAEFPVEAPPEQVTMDSKTAPTENTDDDVSPCCIMHGPALDEDTILRLSDWCCYCLCCGVGWLKETHSPCRCFYKCICVQQICEMVEHENREGVCGSMATCCFCTPLCQLPPPEGTPHCTLCNNHLCGFRRTDKTHKKEATVEDDILTRFEHVVFDHHIPCFCGCCGCALQPFFQTIYNGYVKCICCRFETAVVLPCEPDGMACCKWLLNAGLCTAQCRYPLKFIHNPLAVCCFKKCKRHGHPHSVQDH